MGALPGIFILAKTVSDFLPSQMKILLKTFLIQRKTPPPLLVNALSFLQMSNSFRFNSEFKIPSLSHVSVPKMRSQPTEFERSLTRLLTKCLRKKRLRKLMTRLVKELRRILGLGG